jgi:hypothetical protein
MFLSIGLTIWWFVTMLPFVLLVTPLLIRAVAAAVPSVVPEEVRVHSLKQELPKKTFSLAILIPGLIMILMGLATTYTTLGNYINSFFGEVTFSLIQLMFYGRGFILAVLGIIVYTSRMFLWPRTPIEKSNK